MQSYLTGVQVDKRIKEMLTYLYLPIKNISNPTDDGRWCLKQTQETVPDAVQLMPFMRLDGFQNIMT